MALPNEMKALVRRTTKWDAKRPSAVLELVRRPVPVPGKGEVLVRIEATGCNPSDLSALAGDYARSQSPGEICGFEGCGRVIASGGGMFGTYLKGKRVACVTQQRDGVWAEYAAIPARFCMPVAETMPTAAAAAFFVNPMTSVVLAEIAQKAGARAIILSAGASQASRGVLALCKARGIGVVPIVRRAEQVAELKAAGAAEVLDQSSGDFTGQLREVCGRLKPSLFFDAVGGKLTDQVMGAMPHGAETIVYGGLDERGVADASIPALIFRGARVRGFWLSAYLPSVSTLKVLSIAGQVRRAFAEGAFTPRVAGTCSLEDFPAAIDRYAADMSAGKYFAVMAP